jgi:hypothetical protein
MNNVKDVKKNRITTIIMHSHSLVPDVVNFYGVNDTQRVYSINICEKTDRSPSIKIS